jgi:hypothetical protein
MNTPRTDELDARAAQHASDDMPFDDAMRLCEDLEEKLEMAKFWMQKVATTIRQGIKTCPECSSASITLIPTHQSNEHSN